MRHAKSSWADDGIADHDRPLTDRGRLAAQRLAAHIQRAGIRPGLVLSSTATRARQTLDLVAPALGEQVEMVFERDLYGATAPELLTRVRRLPDQADQVLVVGHNPGLQDLAALLVGEGDEGAMARMRAKFPSGALAALAAGEAPWAALQPGRAVLESFTVPRDLPD